MIPAFSSRRRNPIIESHRRDNLIEWMRDILNHSFVLDAPATYSDSFLFFEDLIEEHRKDPINSRLKAFVPTVGVFHTPLNLKDAFEKYDRKYAISQRRHVCPSFNEFRHILNLAQVISIGEKLSLISFDGDQTLYSDGENFEDNESLAKSIIQLLKAGVKVAIITAAGYGNDGNKYAIRLKGLLDFFITYKLSEEEVSQFFVFGGECNYLLRGHLEAISQKNTTPTPSKKMHINPLYTVKLYPVPDTMWEDMNIDDNLNPHKWPMNEIKYILDTAEKTMKETVNDLKLRARILRKDRAIGIYPGGDEMVSLVPEGHGSNKLKNEALDETVLRVMEALRTNKPIPTIPYCVFNGGRDAWVDIGNKGVAVAVLQSIFKLSPENCLHVGDQFLLAGNDRAAREMCPCIWITSPKETEKILEHVLKYKLGLSKNKKNTPNTNDNMIEQHNSTLSTDISAVSATVTTITTTAAAAAEIQAKTQSHGNDSSSPTHSNSHSNSHLFSDTDPSHIYHPTPRRASFRLTDNRPTLQTTPSPNIIVTVNSPRIDTTPPHTATTTTSSELDDMEGDEDLSSKRPLNDSNTNTTIKKKKKTDSFNIYTG